MLLYDQRPADALATGDKRTYTIKVSTNGILYPLQITLAWTDPPGNPLAGIKLVNDLDLVVTNLDTTNTFYGNDIEAGADFNTRWTNERARFSRSPRPSTSLLISNTQRELSGRVAFSNVCR